MVDPGDSALAAAGPDGRARSRRPARPGERRLVDLALAFLARGVVHRLNNVLALVSSQAQLLEAGRDDRPPRRGARALSDAAERGRRAVAMLDLLGGPSRPTGGPTCAGSLVRAAGDVLLCERAGQRFPVEVRSDPQVFTPVGPQALLATLVLVVEHITRTAPLPIPGSILVEVRAARGTSGPCIVVSFRIDAGHLPFRFPAQPLDAALLRYAARAGLRVRATEDPPRVSIGLPAGSETDLATGPSTRHQWGAPETRR